MLERLEDIETRFYSWTHLSDQQEKDITWLINRITELQSLMIELIAIAHDRGIRSATDELKDKLKDI